MTAGPCHFPAPSTQETWTSPLSRTLNTSVWVGDAELLGGSQVTPGGRRAVEADGHWPRPRVAALDPEHLEGAISVGNEHVGLIGEPGCGTSQARAGRSRVVGADGHGPLPGARALDPQDLDGAVGVDHEQVGLVGHAELRGGVRGARRRGPVLALRWPRASARCRRQRPLELVPGDDRLPSRSPRLFSAPIGREGRRRAKP